MFLGSVWLLHELLSHLILYSSKVGRLLVLFVLLMAFQRDADLVLLPRKLENWKSCSTLSSAQCFFFGGPFPTCHFPQAQSQSWTKTLKLHSVHVIHYMTLADMHVKWSALLSECFGPTLRKPDYFLCTCVELSWRSICRKFTNILDNNGKPLAPVTRASDKLSVWKNKLNIKQWRDDFFFIHKYW